ncbi:MAG TPA: GxxExxY protein [Lacunisphaera sp.]|jgi:GxxExxY protein|nr:GxxExxY protein [Lacunisphaera sp.]
MNPKPINDLSHDLIGAAIEVHRELGPGLLESAYEGAYSHELTLRQIPHVRQKVMPISYKGVIVDAGYRIDILAEERVVVELKAVEKLLPIHSAQLMTYLRLGKYSLGLLMNFNVLKLIDGIERVSNNAPNLSAPSASSAFQNPS